MLRHHYYEGQLLTYEPVSGGGARTLGARGSIENPQGWWLTKGEPLRHRLQGTGSTYHTARVSGVGVVDGVGLGGCTMSFAWSRRHLPMGGVSE